MARKFSIVLAIVLAIFAASAQSRPRPRSRRRLPWWRLPCGGFGFRGGGFGFRGGGWVLGSRVGMGLALGRPCSQRYGVSNSIGPR